MGLLGKVHSYFYPHDFKTMSCDDRVGEIEEGAREILLALEEAGFEAYVVGGCVRDLAMQKKPHDWDITTSARPEDTLRLAASRGWKAIDGGGRRFGTVIIVLDGSSYEVTTFRREVYGADSHRPQQIVFAHTLKEDLFRRDFTVNAMAVDREGHLYDYFDGLGDMKQKKLRTVGVAQERFSEDALRLFRACRFLGELDFTADSSLVEGMESAFPRVQGLSLERVKSEVDRLIVSPHAARGFDLMVRSGLGDCSCRVKEKGDFIKIPILPELSHLVGLPQQKEFHAYDGWYHTLAVLEASKPTLISRWAALLHDVGKGMPGIRAIHKGKLTDYGHDKKGAAMAKDILTRWRRSPSFIHEVVWLVENHMRFHYFANVKEADPLKWIRHMAQTKEFPTSQEAAKAFEDMTDLGKADIIGCGRPLSATEGHEAFGQYMVVLAKDMPVTTKELHYDKEVPAILAPYIKEGMSRLLFRVQIGNLENEEAAIHEAAVRFKRRKES